MPLSQLARWREDEHYAVPMHELVLVLRLCNGPSMVKSGLRLVQALLLQCRSLSSRNDSGFHLLKVLSGLGCLQNGIGLVGQNAVLSSADVVCSLGELGGSKLILVAHELFDAAAIPGASFRCALEVDILCAGGLMFLVEHYLQLRVMGPLELLLR